jgi:homocysteine S-methyltransferase
VQVQGSFRHRRELCHLSSAPGHGLKAHRYQCSLRTFERAGYNKSDAKATMLKAVRLAEEARTIFTTNNADVDQSNIKIALSLGPFGASLTPAQEFDGCYPLPYGPKEFSVHGNNYNSFGQDKGAEQDSIYALAQFHFERLQVFANDSDAWKTIDIIAFETVPLVREVKAIRLAMSWLRRELVTRDGNFKPWWISCVFPSGKCPETRSPSGPNMTARDIIAAAVQQTDSDDSTPIPTGVGANCTSMDFISVIITEMTQAVADFCEPRQSVPWLILYPNGGDIYDPISRTWMVQELAKKWAWAPRIKAVLDDLSSKRALWDKIVVGGCCRTGPDEIHALAMVLGRPSSSTVRAREST